MFLRYCVLKMDGQTDNLKTKCLRPQLSPSWRHNDSDCMIFIISQCTDVFSFGAMTISSVSNRVNLHRENLDCSYFHVFVVNMRATEGQTAEVQTAAV